MALITFFDTHTGINRLMTAMLDVGAHDDWFVADKPVEDAGLAYQKLFEVYRRLIRQAYDEAEPWWADTVAAQRAQVGSDAEAIEAAFDNRMAGPASDPRVVWIVRLVWLQVADLNDASPPDRRIRPETLLLQWLIDAGETELVRLIACMPYWPIGLDETGEWC